MTRLLGTTLNDRYRLDAWAGSGGMSTVYRALDVTLQRQVAVKLMHQEIAEESDQLERFRREARAVAQISDARIVGVIDAGEDGGRPYIVFEYIEGETLSDRIRRQGRLDIDEALTAAIEIAHALAAAHAHGIIHRDVKPHNVLVSSAGAIKVTDFGIARTREDDALTADGRVIGTTDYVSPEQASGGTVTAQSDIYSLGVVLFEMVTGRVPFHGESQVAVALQHVNEPMPDPRTLRPEILPSLAHVIATATAKEPAARYRSDAELIADLNRALAAEVSGADDRETTQELEAVPVGPGPRAPRPRRSPRRRRRAAALGGGLLALLIVAAVAVLVLSTLRDNPHHTAAAADRTAVAVSLCSQCATAYNPDGLDGDTAQNNAQAPQAIDGDTATGWETQNYYDGTLDKAGVGIYVDAERRITLAKLTIVTSTPGFKATIYASATQPSASEFNASGWHALAQIASAGASQTVALTAAGDQTYRYVLVWITKLPSNSTHVEINELSLYRF